ncbi:EF-hand domain-containing protein [Salidesulfovibrio brasiliensis]|uniref:hypothetical protein n=1 Tax=Salidesulfovibrio brasiliensis TaxID=221711 RepID=UPI0006D0EC52|nr:hypothetical protein [Salidesulfovibrio brasiliensis]
MRTLILSISLMLFAAPAWATIFDRCFYSMDANGDDTVTSAELEKAYPGKSEEILEKADTDKGGDLSHDEWENYKAGLGIVEDH